MSDDERECDTIESDDGGKVSLRHSLHVQDNAKAYEEDNTHHPEKKTCVPPSVYTYKRKLATKGEDYRPERDHHNPHVKNKSFASQLLYKCESTYVNITSRRNRGGVKEAERAHPVTRKEHARDGDAPVRAGNAARYARQEQAEYKEERDAIASQDGTATRPSYPSSVLVRTAERDAQRMGAQTLFQRVIEKPFVSNNVKNANERTSWTLLCEQVCKQVTGETKVREKEEHVSVDGSTTRKEHSETLVRRGTPGNLRTETRGVQRDECGHRYGELASGVAQLVTKQEGMGVENAQSTRECRSMTTARVELRTSDRNTLSTFSPLSTCLETSSANAVATKKDRSTPVSRAISTCSRYGAVRSELHTTTHDASVKHGDARCDGARKVPVAENNTPRISTKDEIYSGDRRAEWPTREMSSVSPTGNKHRRLDE